MHQIDAMHKENKDLISKEEYITRLNAVVCEVNRKLELCPTITYFKKVLNHWDIKLDEFKQKVDFTLET